VKACAFQYATPKPQHDKSRAFAPDRHRRVSTRKLDNGNGTYTATFIGTIAGT